MRCHDAKRKSFAQRGEYREQGYQAEIMHPVGSACDQHTSEREVSSSRLCPEISTERIMYAVERQRRITQQLDELRARQRRRTAFLRTTGLKLLGWSGGIIGLLLSVFAVGCVWQPVLLVRILTLLSGVILFLLAVGGEIQEGVSLIPSNNWVLSGAALAVVLLMVLWLRLMRHPQEG